MNKSRLAAFAVLCALLAVPAQALVTPNPASLLSGKKILMIRGTDPTSQEHGAARVAMNAQFRKLRNLVGFQLDTANALTSGVGYQAISGTLLPLDQYDIIFFNYWFHSDNAATLGTFQTNFKNWTKNTLKKRGWLGVHTSGANEGGEWDWFRDSVSAMRYHKHSTSAQAGTIRRTTIDSIKNAPIMDGLPDTVRIPSDEWYDWQYPPLAADSRVMYYLDESSLTNTLPVESRMNPHPSTYYREGGNGNRYFYTALVHNANGVNMSAGNEFIVSMMLRALEYLAGYQEETGIKLNGQMQYQNTDKVKGVRFIRDGLLKIESDKPYRVELRSLQGRLLFSANGRSQGSYTPDALRKPGMYVVKVSAKTGSYSQRVMVQ